MSTVGEVAARAVREWLTPPADQPVTITLAAAIDATDVAITYTDDTLAPDEEDLLAPGAIIEIDSEQCRVTAVDHDTNGLTVTRGVNGTHATSHLIDTDIVVAPTFPRNAVVQAVKDNVVDLYPSVWRTATTQVTASTSYVEVPEDALTVRTVYWSRGDTWREAPLPHMLDPFPPSTTNKAVQLRGIPEGATVHIVYDAKFSAPPTEATELFDYGVEPGWERIIVVGAAAQVVASTPVDILTAEYITEQLEREALPAGASTDVRNGLLTLRSIWLDEATRRLRTQRPIQVVYNPTYVVR